MLDDRQPEAGAAGGPGTGRVDPVEALEDPLQVALGMPMPWSVTAISTGRRRARRPGGRRCRRGCGPGCSRPRSRPGCPARRRAGLGRPTRSGPRCAAAARPGDLLGAAWWRQRSRASATTSSTRDRLGVLQRVVVLHPGQVDELLHQAGQPGRPRAASGRRTARTASGSSAASSPPPTSSDSAPTGVFSSWLTLATKSRRTASIRRASVRSSTSSSTSREPSGATRAETASASPRPVPRRGQVQLDLPYLAVPPGVPGHLEHRVDGQPAAADQPQRVRRRAGLDARRPPRRARRAEEPSTDSTVSTPGGSTGSVCRDVRVGRVCVALAPAERQHGDRTGAAHRRSRRCGDRRVHVHASRLGGRDRPATAIRVATSNTRRPEFTVATVLFTCGAGPDALRRTVGAWGPSAAVYRWPRPPANATGS